MTVRIFAQPSHQHEPKVSCPMTDDYGVRAREYEMLSQVTDLASSATYKRLAAAFRLLERLSGPDPAECSVPSPPSLSHRADSAFRDTAATGEQRHDCLARGAFSLPTYSTSAETGAPPMPAAP